MRFSVVVFSINPRPVGHGSFKTAEGAASQLRISTLSYRLDGTFFSRGDLSTNPFLLNIFLSIIFSVPFN